MKYIKQFKLFETGEWDRDIDWDYVKENPDDDSQEAGWIKFLQEQLEYIIDDLEDPSIFEIIDIKGFDMYQGPYATVKIFKVNYTIWTLEYNDLYIEDFFITNTEENENAGFKGRWSNISDMLNEIIEAGGIEVYLNTKKYNL